MVYKKIAKPVPTSLLKTTDPYAARTVLRELYSKGLFVIKGEKYPDRVNRRVRLFSKAELKNPKYTSIFEKFVEGEDGSTIGTSERQDRKTAVALGKKSLLLLQIKY
jgi:hypothetical protein